MFLKLLSLGPWEKKAKRRHFSDDYEDFFTNLLTESRSCGMIGRAWIRPAVGMRMQRRRLPLGLLFSPRLCCITQRQAIISSREKEGGDFVENAFPRCRKCSEGDLVPLSDFGSQGASIEYKAWVCTNPSCLYNIKIRNGDIIINEPISDGSLHSYRSGRS